MGAQRCPDAHPPPLGTNGTEATTRDDTERDGTNSSVCHGQSPPSALTSLCAVRRPVRSHCPVAVVPNPREHWPPERDTTGLYRRGGSGGGDPFPCFTGHPPGETRPEKGHETGKHRAGELRETGFRVARLNADS